MPHEILVIAAKEYRDAITSRYFLVVLAILIIISTTGFLHGLNYYNSYVDSYKAEIDSPKYQEMANQIRQQINVAEASNASAGEIDALKDRLSAMIDPEMPSAIMFFDGINSNLTFIGMLLAICIGFNLVSKEIEEGSLKMLLSHPVHRDSIILGKITGAVLLLFTVLLIVYAIALAAMLLYGIVPGPDDLGRIAISLIVSLLYLTVFLAISIATSALTKKSSISILIAFGIAFFAMLLPSIATYAMQLEIDYSQPAFIADGQIGNVIDNDAYNSILERDKMISSTIAVIMPRANYDTICRNVLLTNIDSKSSDSLTDTFSKILVNVCFLLVEIIAVIVITFIRFLRTDLLQE